MNLQILKAELDGDPLARGYSGMTDKQAADSLNAQDRPRNRTSISGDEIFNAADGAELAALATSTAANQRKFQMFLALCGRDSVDPFGTANVALIQETFGGGSSTVATLAGLRIEQISRAQELSLGTVNEGDVQAARSI